MMYKSKWNLSVKYEQKKQQQQEPTSLISLGQDQQL